MGAFDWIGDIFGGVGDVIDDVVSPFTNALGLGGLSSILGGYKNQLTGENAMQMNRENIAMQRETNQQQMLMHQGDMQLARELQSDSQAFNAAEAEKARQFNSASAMMERYISAGINPFAAMQSVTGATGNASGVSASSPIASAPSMPQLVAPRNDISTGTLPLNNLIAAFGMVSQVIERLGGAKRNRAEARSILEQLEPTVELIKNQNKESSIKQISMRISNDILKVTGMVKAKQEIKNLVQEWSESVARCNYLALEGETELAKQELTRSQKIGQDLNNKATRIQNKYLEPMLQQSYNEVSARIRNLEADSALKGAQKVTEDVTRGAKVRLLNAQAYEALQSGELSNEQKNSIREILPYQKRWQELLNDGKVVENSKLEQKLTNEINLQLKELEKAGLVNKQEVEKLGILQKENKLKFIKEATAMFTSLVNSAGSLMPNMFLPLPVP